MRPRWVFGAMVTVSIAGVGCSGFFDPQRPPIDANGAPTIDSGGIDASAAPIAFVQGAIQSNMFGTGVGATFSVAQQAGDLDLVIVTWSADGELASLLSLVDTAGNPYTIAIGPQSSGDDVEQVVFVAPGIAAAGAGSNSVQAVFGASTACTIAVVEYRGIDAANPIDTTVGNLGGGVALSTGTLTTMHAHDLLVAVGDNTGGIDAPAGFTPRVGDDDFALVDQQVETVGDYTATTTGGNGPWVFQLIALRGR